MSNLKNISILSFLAILALVHSDNVTETEESLKSEYPYTLIAVGPTNPKSYFCKVEIYNPENDSWSMFTEFKMNMHDEYTPFVSHGKLFIFGGKIGYEVFTDEVFAFDLVTKSSSYLAPMEQEKGIVGVAEIDGYIYVSGGMGANYTILDIVERYDPASNTWTEMAPMLTEKYYHAVDTWEGKMYVAGGVSVGFDDLNSLEIYDPKSNSWTEGTPMQIYRLRFPIVFWNNHLFALGGNWSIDGCPGERLDLSTQEWSNITNTMNKTVWTDAVVFNDKIIVSGREIKNYELNPKTNEFKKMNPKIISRSFAKSFVVPNTLVPDVQSLTVETTEESSKSDYPFTLIALGPSIPKSNSCILEAYNPETDSWSTFDKFQLNATDEYTAFVSNGKIFVFGGRIAIDECLDEVVAFDLATRKSSYLAPMGQKKKSAGVVEIDGYIYVSGGMGENFTVLDAVERYDPASNTWTVMAPMLKERYFHAVNTWEGKMYVAGGITEEDDNLNTLEIYDPHSNSWTTGTPMQFERYKFSIVFSDGSLFAIGGNWTLDDVPGERLDLNTQEWSNITNTIENSVWTSAVVFDKNIIIAGNMNNNYELNPKTNELRKLNPKKVLRSSPKSFLIPKTLVSDIEIN
ncbi:uncharacterized protein LOC143916827 [Arctopsyche grandis]|uniref:uncharacterized protein LOC143916827 n=1 Tax=Arctopsyche grandis TaxID=121162 RepID=UPI00406D9F61